MAIDIQSNTLDNVANKYDQVPYESYPHSASAPFNMMAIGTLFGMQPKDFKQARILELGCAAGGNIIPHALNYPKCSIVGVDLSKVQIEQANNIKAQLNIKNLEFKNMSILDIDDSLGKFDYIICHGVISWVPDEVQAKIFSICKNNLAENGIAYVSYNTLPGWNMIRSIRDMMLYHTENFTLPQEKTQQARLIIKFVSDSLEGSNTPYAQALKQELEMLSKHADYYLMHDHLEDNNKQFYFKDFIKSARANNLQYLADSSLSSMFLPNMPALAVEKLQELNDIVRSEQYMDFITNRRFRTTLLCHDNVQINRSINNEDIKKFNLLLNITPQKLLADIDIEDVNEEVKFEFNNASKGIITTKSPYMKAVLYSFAENINNPISFKDLVQSAAGKLKNKDSVLNIEHETVGNAMKLVFQGYMSLTMNEHKKNNLVKPKATAAVSYQISHSSNLWATNNNHEVIPINILDKHALKYMNGKNTKDDIANNIIEDVKKGELSVSRDNTKVEDPDIIKQELAGYMENMIAKIANSGLLE